MKKQATRYLVILIISMGVAVLVPNFLTHNKVIAWHGLASFIKWTLIIFGSMVFLLFATKPKKASSAIPDGYQELFNENNQLTKAGIFSGGELVNGKRHVYAKNGTLSHIEICKDGVYTKDSSAGQA